MTEKKELKSNCNAGVPYMWPISYEEATKTASSRSGRSGLDYRGYQVCVFVNEVLAKRKFESIQFIDADFFYHHVLREDGKSAFYTYFTRVRAKYKLGDGTWKDIFFVLEQGDNWFPHICESDIPEKIEIDPVYGHEKNKPHYGYIRLKITVLDCQYDEIPLLPVSDFWCEQKPTANGYIVQKIDLHPSADFSYRYGVMTREKSLWIRTWSEIEEKIVGAYKELREDILSSRMSDIKAARKMSAALLERAELDEKFMQEYLCSKW